MLAERGIAVSHTTILRWVVRYVPEFEKRWSRYARRVNSSWRVDETYISVRGKWHTFTSTILLSKKNLRAVQLFLGHTKLESTVRYLGIGSAQISDLVRRGHMDHVRGRIINIGRARSRVSLAHKQRLLRALNKHCPVICSSQPMWQRLLIGIAVVPLECVAHLGKAQDNNGVCCCTFQHLKFAAF